MTDLISDLTPEEEKMIIQGLLEETDRVLNKVLPDRLRPPSINDSVAIALFQEKTAALCYDKIWAPSNVIVPDSIRCFGDMEAEKRLLILMALKAPHDNRKEISLPHKYYWTQFFEESSLTHIWSRRLNPLVKEPKLFCIISHQFYSNWQVSAVPIYNSKQQHDAAYNQGDRAVVLSMIDSIELVDEESLTWSQVEEFRKDKDCRHKYRCFIHWLDKEMIGKSQSFIEDEIAIKLEDYENALKKHGIKTLLGTVSEALDGKYFIGASSVVGSLTLAGHPLIGLLTGGLLIAGKITIKLGQSLLELKEIHHGKFSEIAWIYEIKNRAVV